MAGRDYYGGSEGESYCGFYLHQLAEIITVFPYQTQTRDVVACRQ